MTDKDKDQIAAAIADEYTFAGSELNAKLRKRIRALLAAATNEGVDATEALASGAKITMEGQGGSGGCERKPSPTQADVDASFPRDF